MLPLSLSHPGRPGASLRTLKSLRRTTRRSRGPEDQNRRNPGIPGYSNWKPLDRVFGVSFDNLLTKPRNPKFSHPHCKPCPRKKRLVHPKHSTQIPCAFFFAGLPKRTVPNKSCRTPDKSCRTPEKASHLVTEHWLASFPCASLHSLTQKRVPVVALNRPTA